MYLIYFLRYIFIIKRSNNQTQYKEDIKTLLKYKNQSVVIYAIVLFLTLNYNANAKGIWATPMQINLPIQEDSIAEKSNVIKEYFAEKLKGNIIIKYFEKLKKKKDIKEGQLSLESERIKDLLSQKRLNYYNPLYSGPPLYQFHAKDLSFYLSNFKDTIYKTELDWNKIQRIDPEPFNTNKTSYQSDKFIYGFHPYWMGNAYYNYNFEIYDRIAYYGYIINPKNGRDLSTSGNFLAHSWSTSTIQYKANYYNCKVDLCVASYDINNNIKIFNNSKKAHVIRDTVIANIVELVKESGNGVCFDIQKVPNKFKDNYIDLIQKINTLLNGDSNQKVGNKKFQITVLLPRYDIGFPYSMNLDDAEQLKNHVDRWIFSGESTYGNNFSAGEISEENLFGFWNFDQIDFELNALPPSVFENLIMEIPLYYGKSFEENDTTNITISKFSDMDKMYPNFSPMFNKAFEEKITYVNLKGVNGIALWCLGYDQNNESIFNSLVNFINDNQLENNEVFVSAINHIIDKNKIDIVGLYRADQLPIKNSWVPNSIFSLIENLKPKKFMTHHLIVLCLIIILTFVFLGFVISLFFEAARAHIFSKENILNFSTILILLTTALVFKKFKVITETEFVFAVGIFTGIIIALIFYRRLKKNEKELKP